VYALLITSMSAMWGTFCRKNEPYAIRLRDIQIFKNSVTENMHKYNFKIDHVKAKWIIILHVLSGSNFKPYILTEKWQPYCAECWNSLLL
jgi:hypothetical protein